MSVETSVTTTTTTSQSSKLNILSPSSSSKSWSKSITLKDQHKSQPSGGHASSIINLNEEIKAVNIVNLF